jgi:8-oxo-dGTP pyrophosphatase MutT (NUDIX family)
MFTMAVYAIVWHPSQEGVRVLIGRKARYNRIDGYIHNNGGTWCLPGGHHNGHGSAEFKATLELVEETGFDPDLARQSKGCISCLRRDQFSVFAYEVSEEHAMQYDYKMAKRYGEQEARRKYKFPSVWWCSEFCEAKFVPLAEAATMLAGEASSWNDEHIADYVKALPSMGEQILKFNRKPQIYGYLSFVVKQAVEKLPRVNEFDLTVKDKHGHELFFHIDDWDSISADAFPVTVWWYQNRHVKEWQRILKTQPQGPDAVVDKLMQCLRGMKNDWWVKIVDAFQRGKFETYGGEVHQLDARLEGDCCCEDLDFLTNDDCFCYDDLNFLTNDDSDCDSDGGSHLYSRQYGQVFKVCVPVSVANPRPAKGRRRNRHDVDAGLRRHRRAIEDGIA